MKNPLLMPCALVAGIALSLSATAARLAPDGASHNEAVSAVRAKLASARAAQVPSTAIRSRGSVAGTPQAAAISATASPQAMGQYVYPGVPMANPYRAYPPSCAAYPLPDKASGPSNGVWSQRVSLYTRDAQGNPKTPETVTITIWRLACSSTGNLTPYNTDGGFNAMTLMRIDRDPANDNNTNTFPTFPLLQIKQGSIGYGDTASLVRAADEPNTVLSDGMFDAPIYSSTTYVLENFNYGAAFEHYYSYAFNLLVTPYANGVDPAEFQISDYNPTQSTYPDAFNPLPLDGYMSGTWYDPAHSGEGIQIEVAEQLDGAGNLIRPFVFTWYTFDSNGIPFWIVGNALLDPNNPLGVTTSASYATGGRFGGNSTSVNRTNWGTVSFQFINCNSIQVTYASNGNLPAGVPGGSGVLNWSRLTNVNGMACE